MIRPIRAPHDRAPAGLEPLGLLPEQLHFPLDPAINRCALTCVVREGAAVAAGAELARGDALAIHAPLSGTVRRAGPDSITLDVRAAPAPAAPFPAVPEPGSAGDLPAFAATMGLVGMGGSLFPASLKFKAAQTLHTLVVNAVECEPGIQIDEALLAHDTQALAAGIRMLKRALAIRKVVLALKRQSVARLGAVLAAEDVGVLAMPNTYPAGAEKLIVERLTGRRPAAGVLPVQVGLLVFSVASVWAIGRRLREGRPCIDRPLTLVVPDAPPRNLVVPVGTPIGHLLTACGVAWDEARHVLVAGGLMMGRRTRPDAPVTKGTNAIFVQPVSRRLRKPEEPCILCGSCFDACPLGLHPIGMAERIRARRPSPALRAQLDECFLCGACSAVCPAEIPLVQVFHEGKAWLRAHK